MQITPPKIHTWVTDHGTMVWFVADHSQPMLDISLLFHAGASRDGAFPGLARLTARMLDEGTDRHNAEQIAMGFEQVGASYRVAVGMDNAALSLRTLSDQSYLLPAVDLFHEVLTAPSFPEKSYRRLQRNSLTEYDALMQRPQYVAKQSLLEKLYGSQGYGHLPIGDKVSVAAISRDHLRRFYQIITLLIMQC